MKASIGKYIVQTIDYNVVQTREARSDESILMRIMVIYTWRHRARQFTVTSGMLRLIGEEVCATGTDLYRHG
jgi:hypothetical protein